MEQYSLLFAPERQIFSVSELNSSIRSTLETEFCDISVAGEISGVRLATSGHCYFTFKERDCTVKCVVYRSTYRYMKFKPKDGISAIARGSISVFEARGEYQLQVESLEPVGAGALQAAFEELKKKLAAEGLFDATRKRKLPAYPRRIGIVTSTKGAVLSDILHVLERRFPGLAIRVFPAQVQGEGSIEEVCRGLAHFSEFKWADVVIVARGGGSIEDLWTFNTEAVARAIASCSVPVVSAVGHETDVTIADFVADLRAPTPSAAAEVICMQKSEILESIAGCRAKLLQLIRFRVASAMHQLQKQGIERATSLLHRFIGRQLQNVDDKEHRLRDCARNAMDRRERKRRELQERVRHFDIRPKLERGRGRLEAARERAVTIMNRKLARRDQSLDNCAASLRQLSPLRILDRGYAIVTDANARIVRDEATVPPGADIRVRLAQGGLQARVTAQQEGEGS